MFVHFSRTDIEQLGFYDFQFLWLKTKRLYSQANRNKKLVNESADLILNCLINKIVRNLSAVRTL